MNKGSILYKSIEVPQQVKAIAFGLIVMFGLWILNNAITFGLYRLTTLYRYDFNTHKLNLPVYVQLLFWIPYLLGLFSPILAGFIIGKMLRKQYFKHTFFLGLVVSAIPICFTLSVLIWPDKMFGKHIPQTFVTSYVYKHLLNELISTAKTILLAVVGGYIGSRHKMQIV